MVSAPIRLSVYRFRDLSRIVSNVQSRFAMQTSEPFGLLCHHARRPHHIDHAGGKAKQQEYDEAPGRSRQQAIETPAESRSDKNTCNQFGGEAKPDGHGGCLGLSRVLLASRLASPDFSAVPNFGQPLIQTSEPCGKRSFVGGRLFATAISAVVRAVRHDVETRNVLRLMENRPVTLKSRADHTDGNRSSQDCVLTGYIIDLL